MPSGLRRFLASAAMCSREWRIVSFGFFGGNQRLVLRRTIYPAIHQPSVQIGLPVFHNFFSEPDKARAFALAAPSFESDSRQAKILGCGRGVHCS